MGALEDLVSYSKPDCALTALQSTHQGSDASMPPYYLELPRLAPTSSGPLAKPVPIGTLDRAG